MALVLPEGEFLGLDRASAPITKGQEMIRVLGLRNIALRQEDLRRFAGRTGAAAGPFDFIIAHGVYSWVPHEAREALLAICASHLAPHGVAYVSYNAYPGSHVRAMVWEMLRYHTAEGGDSRLAITRAQGLARLLAEVLPEAEELAFLRAELRAVAERAPAVLFHDDLAPENRPVYFHEFMARASAHGLQYLAEADFQEMQTRSFPPRLAPILESIEQERGLVAKEQYLDFVKVRRFRQTLLCRAEVRLDRSVTGEKLEGFAMASPVEPVSTAPDLGPGVVEEFRGPKGAVIRVDLPLAKAALLHLGEAWPRRVPLSEVRDGARARLADRARLLTANGDDETRALAEILFEAYAAGLVQLHTFMPTLALQPTERPTASPLARLQASRADSPLVATLLHTPVRVEDPLGRYALQLLDGTRDRMALLAALRHWVREQRRAGAVPEATSSGEVSPARLEEQLRGLARLGLLVA